MKEISLEADSTCSEQSKEGKMSTEQNGNLFKGHTFKSEVLQLDL